MATQSVLEQQQERRPVRPPPDQTLKCPRCDSTNTKFCYYNNYSLSQPRYFCKACRRYWTKGGSLRNVPVGGGCRKNKRTSSSSSSSKKNVAQLGRVMSGCTSSSNNSPVVNPSFFPSLLTYDSSDLTLAFDEHGAHNQYDFLGNYPCSTGFRSSFVDAIPSNLHCFYKVENGGDNCDEDNMVLSSAAAAEASTVTAGKRDQFYSNDDVREIGENSSKMYWNFPWQLGGEANIGSTSSTVIDSTGRECWINNGSSTSWHGLVNSSLM